MNYYNHHIGDFNNATRHLTRVERSLYRDLIELYYDTEQPLNSDFNKLARRVLAHTEDERQALQIVLEEFFTLEDDGWHSKRCDAEITKYQSSAEQASKAGKASAAKRSAAKQPDVDAELNDRATTVGHPLNENPTTVERPLNDRSTNQEPRTNNQEPINTPKAPKGAKTGGEVEAMFDAFWKTYPNKVGKDAARKAFAKRNPDEHLLATMLAALESQKRSLAWTKDDGQFIPHPSTWLSQGRWMDEGAASGANSPGGWRSNPIFAGAI